MPSGAIAPFTLACHRPPAPAPGTPYRTLVTASAADDIITVDNARTAGTGTRPQPTGGLSSDNTSRRSAAAAGGATFDYVVTLSNSGPHPGSDVSFSDPLPAGVVFVALVQDTGPSFSCNAPAPNSGGTVACTIPLFGNGASAQFTITVRAQ